MIDFIFFAFYLTIGTVLLIVWPLLLHPTLSLKRKMVLCTIGFILIVPGGLALYAWLGAPQMAAH